MATNIVEMFYFADRADWLSMVGGASMLLSNVIWTGCVFYYLNVEKWDTLFDDAFADLSLYPRP